MIDPESALDAARPHTDSSGEQLIRVGLRAGTAVALVFTADQEAAALANGFAPVYVHADRNVDAEPA